MQEKLLNILVAKQIPLKFKSLEELAKVLLDIMTEDKKQLQEIINIFAAEQRRSLVFRLLSIHLLCEKLSSAYNINIDASALINETYDLINERWDEINKFFKDQVDAMKLIDSVFKKKNESGKDD